MSDATEIEALRREVAGLTGLVSAVVNAMVVLIETHPNRKILVSAWGATDEVAFAPDWMSPASRDASKGMTLAFGDIVRGNRLPRGKLKARPRTKSQGSQR